jgi:dTDP-4-amino-4,6-dideoxygalactose transaminase
MILMNDFKRQVASLRVELDEAVSRVLTSGWFVLGQEVEAFERELGAYLGVDAELVVGVGNGMDALTLSLMAAGVGPGDEVVTTPNSAFATALAILQVGARPVFVDLDLETYALDARRVEAAITPSTRAILPVHIYGQSADLAPMLALCEAKGLVLIGDACQAHGARYGGRDVSAYGFATAYSFYPTKNLGCFGDGGGVTCARADTAARVRALRNYGQTSHYHHDERGLNSRLDELQAAILRVKLRHLPTFTARRGAIAARYNAGLAGLPIVLPVEKSYGEAVHHLYVLRSDRRDALREHLRTRGVQSLVHYPTILPLQPAMGALQARPGDFPIAERCAQEFLSLPMHPDLTDAEVDEVVAAVRSFF